MELKLGKMTNKELAEWFGITEGTFKNNKVKKLDELKLFADFIEQNGKIYIREIYEPIYNKQQKKTLQKVVDKIDEVWNINGLDTCSHVGAQICELLNKEGFQRQESTIVKYTREGRNELYGKPFVGEGKLGKCIYIWCKRNPKTGEYSLLTEEEQKIKEELQKKYFGDTTEKQILVKAMLEAKEITKDEAWDILEEMTNMKNNNFLSFLKDLQERLHCQVIRGTLVERNAFATVEDIKQIE